jgi:hypothetical protein
MNKFVSNNQQMKVIFYLFMLTIVSCASLKKQEPTHSGVVIIHQPYCGGARPTPEIAKGTTSPYKNATFLIKTKMSNDDKHLVEKIKTDEIGAFKTNLKSGNYIVIHEDKTLSFEDYVKKYNTPSNNQSYVGDKDAKIQYEAPDIELVVVENQKIELIYNAVCFIGINRLLKYTGKLPQ